MNKEHKRLEIWMTSRDCKRLSNLELLGKKDKQEEKDNLIQDGDFDLCVAQHL